MGEKGDMINKNDQDKKRDAFLKPGFSSRTFPHWVGTDSEFVSLSFLFDVERHGVAKKHIRGIPGRPPISPHHPMRRQIIPRVTPGVPRPKISPPLRR